MDLKDLGGGVDLNDFGFGLRDLVFILIGVGCDCADLMDLCQFELRGHIVAHSVIVFGSTFHPCFNIMQVFTSIVLPLCFLVYFYSTASRIPPGRELGKCDRRPCEAPCILWSHTRSFFR